MDFTLRFVGPRAEFVNKYCLTTGRDTPQADPSVWTVSGSQDGVTFTLLKEERGVLFESRGRSYCFSIPAPHDAFAVYRLRVAATAGASTALSLAGWSLLLENPELAQAPPLAFSPALVSAYVGFAFPGVVCSSALYTTFAVTPALPAGLVLYTHTGVIRGVPTAPLPATTFTLTAVDNRGNAAQTTVTISVDECASIMVAFSLHFQFEARPEACGYALKDRATGGVVDERASFRRFEELTIPFCRPAASFLLVLRKGDAAGWGGNRASVVLADGHGAADGVAGGGRDGEGLRVQPRIRRGAGHHRVELPAGRLGAAGRVERAGLGAAVEARDAGPLPRAGGHHAVLHAGVQGGEPGGVRDAGRDGCGARRARWCT